MGPWIRSQQGVKHGRAIGGHGNHVHVAF